MSKTRNHKITEVFACMDGVQMQRFKDFVNSPYFNKNESVVEIFEYFFKLHPQYAPEDVSPDVILKNASSVSDENDLAKKMTLLYSLVQKFLAAEIVDDPVMEQINAIKAFKKNNLPKHAYFIEQQLRKQLEQQQFRDFEYWWRAHKLEEECFEGFEKVLQRNSKNSMELVMTTLENFYQTKKLRFEVEAANRQRILGIPAKNNEKQHSPKDFFDDDLYRKVYKAILVLQQKPFNAGNKRKYLELKSVLFKHKNVFPVKELNDLIFYIQNYCLCLLNRGDTHFLKEYLEIINFRIANEILLTDGKLSPLLFKNIITVAIKLEEASWAEFFIKTFKNFLPENQRDDYVHLALGQIAYIKGDLKKASRHIAIASHNKDDIYFGFTVKKMLLKMGFESGDPALDSYIEMYRKHLDRHSAKTGANGILLEKFFLHFRILAKAIKDKAGMEILLNKLNEEEEDFPDKDWLIQMAQKFVRKDHRIYLPAN